MIIVARYNTAVSISTKTPSSQSALPLFFVAVLLNEFKEPLEEPLFLDYLLADAADF